MASTSHRIIGLLVLTAVVGAGCGDDDAAEPPTTVVATTTTTTPTTTTSTTVAPTTAAPTTTVAAAESAAVDVVASIAVAQEFVRALFDTRVEAALALAHPQLDIAFVTPADMEAFVAEFGPWQMITRAATCTEKSQTGTNLLLRCSAIVDDGNTRIAPYTYELVTQVDVQEQRVVRIGEMALNDRVVAIHGVEKTVVEWNNEWLIENYPNGIDGVGDKCRPAPSFYCPELFVHTAREFWDAHPEILAAVTSV